MATQEQVITCTDCGGQFHWTAQEQEYYAEQQMYAPPKRCKPCRQAKKERRGDADRKGGNR